MTSVRASQFYAAKLYESGFYQEAREVIEDASKSHEESLALPLTLAVLDCGTDGYTFPHRDLVERARFASFETAVFEALDKLQILVEEGECPGLSIDQIEKVYIALLENKRYVGLGRIASMIYQKLSKLALIRRDLDAVVGYLDKACEYDCNANIRIAQAWYLLSAGLISDAKEKYRQALELLSTREKIKNPWINERIETLRVQLYAS